MLRATALVLATLLAGGCATSGDRLSEAKLRKAATYNAQLGAGYLARGNLEQAKAKFEKALDQDPDNAKANSGFALLQARLGKDPEAQRYFERAIALDPDDSEVLNNFGAYLCDKGRRPEAEKRFLAAARNPLYKTPEFAYRNAGTCALTTGDLDAAEVFFGRALESNPRFAPALLDLVDLNRERSRYQAALTYLERYHRLFPQSPESLFMAVNIHRDLGNRNLASTYATRLNTLFPLSPEAQSINESSSQ